VPNGRAHRPTFFKQATVLLASAAAALEDLPGGDYHLMLVDRSVTFKLIAFALARMVIDAREGRRTLASEAAHRPSLRPGRRTRPRESDTSVGSWFQI